MRARDEPHQPPERRGEPGDARAPSHRAPGGAAFAGVLAFGMLAGTLMQFTIGALGPLMTTEVGLSRTQLGTLVSVYFVVGAAASPALGRVADRIGGRYGLMATFALGAVSMAIFAAAPLYGVLLLGVSIGGLAGAASNPATNLLIATHLPRGRQGTVTGLKQSGVPLGALLAGVALPPLALTLGWRGALLACAVLLLAGIPLGLLVLPRDTGRSALESTHAELARARSMVRWLSAYALLMGAGTAGVTTYAPLYGFERLHLSPAGAGLVTALLGLMGVGARIAWSRMAEHRVEPSLALVLLAATGVAAQAMLAGAEFVGPWLLWSAVTLFGLSVVAWNGVVMLVVVREVPRQVAGHASGKVVLAFYTGLVLSPIPFGWTVDRFGTYLPGWLGLAMAFAFACVLAALWRRQRASAPQAPRPPGGLKA